jgi:hypothetical protein
MTPIRPSTPRSGRSFAVGLLAIGLALSPLASAALPAAAVSGVDDTLPVAVTLASLRPISPQPGDSLVLRGNVKNISAEPVSNLAIQLRMSGPLSARSTFDAFADDPTGPVTDLSVALTSVLPLPISGLDAGEQEPFTFRVALDPTLLGLPTSSWQVRELGIAVTGSDSFGATSLGNLRTFLPWAPREAIGPQPLQVAWLWPLIDRPHRDSSVVWRDDGLTQELQPGGRLSGLIDAAATAANQMPPATPGKGKRHKRAGPVKPPARNVAITWAIDPMLLDDLDAMRTNYQVVHAPKPATGAGGTAARDALTKLRTATDGADVIPLPYGDPDVAAAVRNSLATLVGVAATTGRRVIERLLPAASLVQAGWPSGGLIDQRGVDALFSDGATSMVLSDAALPPVIAPNQTPSSLASLVTAAGDIPTVLSDSILSTAMSEGADDPASSRLTLQRYLAETLMIEAEAPSTPTDQRSVLIAPARRWDPTPTLAGDLLADTGKVPWLRSTTVGAILTGEPDTAVERQPLTYPGAARRDELPGGYVREVAHQQHLLSQLTNILPPNDSETRPFSTTLLRALSSAWRDQPAARRVWLKAFSDGLKAMTSAVHIVSKAGSTVTLTGHCGKVPVTIANDLDAPASITVQLNASERLKLPHNGREQVTIPPNRQTTVDVHATAKTSGVFPLEVQLLTPSGQKYGLPVQLYVRSTVYGTITLVITGAATGLLLIAVAIRLIRRARAAKRSAELTP